MSTVRRRTAINKLNVPFYDSADWGNYVDENWDILDAIIAQFMRLTGVKGVWKNSTLYNVDDVIVDADSGSLYTATQTHTSNATGSFAQDRIVHPYWTLTTQTSIKAPNSVVRPEDFGADPEALSVDYTSAMQRALDEALMKGLPLQIDYLYRCGKITADLSTYNFLRIQGNGGLFNDNDLDEEPILDIVCTPEQIVSLTANPDNAATRDYSSTGSSSKVARLPLPNGHTIKAGMLCKLIDDTPVLASATSEFDGEVVYIKDVDATNAYTASRLRNTYTVNPRLAVYRQWKKVQVSDITVMNDYDNMVTEGRKNQGIRVQGLIGAIFERVQFTDNSMDGLRLQGCVSTMILSCAFRRGLNAISTLGITGYGVKDNNSEYTMMIGCRGVDCRHVFTTDTTHSDTGNPWTYGAPFGFILDDCIGANCSSTPWDTHPASRQGVFSNLQTFNTYEGNQAALGGIQLSGRDHYVVGCKHYGAGDGIIIGTLEPDSQVKHRIKDYVYEGSGYGIWCQPDTGTCIFELSDANIITTNQYGGIRLTRAKCIANRVNVTNKYGGQYRRMIELQGDATFEGDECTFDHSNNPQTSTWIVGYRGANNVFNLRRGEAKAGTSTWDMLVFNDSGSATSLSAMYDVRADKSPISVDGIDSAVPLNGLLRRVRVNEGVTSDTASRTVNITTATHNVTIDGCLAPVVIRSLVASASGKSISSIEDGVFIGQKLIILNKETSTNSFDLLGTASNVLLVATITISVKSGVELIWNGADWVVTSSTVNVTGGTGVTNHAALTGLAADDHTQYLTNARFDTRLAAQSISILADVPNYSSTDALKYARINSTGSAVEFASPLDLAAADDAAKIVQNTYASDKSGKTPSSLNVYPPVGDGTNTAVRLYSGTDKGYWVELIAKLKHKLFDVYENASSKLEMRIFSTGAVVKHFLSTDFIVFGGTNTDRVNAETVRVKGELYVDSIVGPNMAGDYANPYIIGTIRIWDDNQGTGRKLRAKAGSDPANATDGSVLW